MPMDARGFAGDGETPGIRYRALLASAVGEVGGWGEGTVVQLQKHATRSDPSRGRERAFAFPGLRRLQLTHNPPANTTKRSTQQQWALFSSVAPAADARARGQEADAQREADASLARQEKSGV